MGRLDAPSASGPHDTALPSIRHVGHRSTRPAWDMRVSHFALAYPLYFLLTWLLYYVTRARGLR